MNSAARACVCGAGSGLRPYPCGWRCPAHTPAALAGQIEPDEIRDRHHAALALLADHLDALPVYPHPPGLGGPCARCRATCHRYGPGGSPTVPDLPHHQTSPLTKPPAYRCPARPALLRWRAVRRGRMERPGPPLFVA